MASAAGELHWVEAEAGYALALESGRLVCRNAKGKQIGSVPAAVRDGEVAVQLRALRDWMAAHEAVCLATVEAWMLRSLPVPLPTLAPLWPDPSWQKALADTVVAPRTPAGGPDWASAGLLRGVDERGAAVVTLDGETERVHTDQLLVPHPVLFEDLADWRDFATDLDVAQGVPQLYRETFAKPDDVDAEAGTVGDYANAVFKELRHATARCRTLGVAVSGGYAVSRVWEGGRQTEARYWIGADAPEAQAWTGELVWVDAESRRLRLGEVGPVAWSEGVRMASLIYAARAVEEGEEV